MNQNRKTTMYLSDICVGDKFYYNNYTVAKKLSLPDYLIVVDVKDNFVTAKYENHYVYTKERKFSKDVLQYDSNLNPYANDPDWIFLKISSKAS